MNSWFLSNVSWPLMALGSAAGLAGIWLLYLAWCERKRHWGLVATGWSLIVGAYWPWGAAAGFDRGAAAGTALLMVCTLVLIAFRGDWRGAAALAAADRRPPEPAEKPDRRLVSRSLRFLIAGPLAAAAALALALLLFAVLPGSEPNRIMSTALACILLWSAFATWIASTENLTRATALLVGTGGGASLAIAALA